MKSIYIFLTKSDTCVSKMISLATADEYTHISIAFDKDLYPMYSFARKYLYTPLPAGLRIEPLQDGFYKRNDSIPCALYELKVSDESYKKAKALVSEMMEEEKLYKFNILGLILCRMNISYKRNQHYFCSEFVSEILQKSEAIQLPKNPSLMRPADYTQLEELDCLYEGQLCNLALGIA